MRRRSTARPRCIGRCASDDLDTADLLIRAGAKVSAANREGATPMLLAAMNGNAAMIDKLVKAGADPNAPLTQSGDTALMMASRTGKTDAINVLLDNGAKVNAAGDLGRHDRADVGRFRAPSGRREVAHRARRRRQCPLQLRAGRQRPRL